MRNYIDIITEAQQETSEEMLNEAPKFGLAAAAGAALAASSPAVAQTAPTVPATTVSATTTPTAAPTNPNLNADLLLRINTRVNGGVRFRPEGRDRDNWQIPNIGGIGDCEDFALLKRNMLIEAGWPANDLRIIVVTRTVPDENGERRTEGHAVLYVASLGVVLDSPVEGDVNASNPIRTLADWQRVKGWRTYCTIENMSLGGGINAMTRCDPNTMSPGARAARERNMGRMR